MRAIHYVLVIGLLLALAGACGAQMDQPQTEQQRAQATVQLGPVVRAGMPRSADVFVDGRFALRIPASAGGMSPTQRGQIIADRMNQAFDQGMSWENMRVSQVRGLWTVSMNGMLIATADDGSARAYRISSGALASRWANQTVVAMGGEPQVIAMQLRPIPAVVAGAREELPMNWAVSPTKMAPLLNATTGETVGNVMVGGPSDRLNLAKAVALYQYSADGAIVRSFVPITSASIGDQIIRAHGVGLVGMPANVLPMTGFRTGAEVAQMATQMSAQWNNLINASMRGRNLQVGANTKVVPLYSMDEKQVIGAAQVVGTASGVAQTQSVVVATRDDMLQFRARTAQYPPATETTALNDVVVSALIHVPEQAETPTAAPPYPPAIEPETTPPESSETSPPAPPME